MSLNVVKVLNVIQFVPKCNKGPNQTKKLMSLLSLYKFFWLIRSLVDPVLAAFNVCGPLQFGLLINEFSDRRSSKI